MDPGPWMEEGAVLNRTLCLGQMCMMEYLIGATLIPFLILWVSSSLWFWAKLNSSVVPSSSQSLKTQWGLRKKETRPAFFSHTHPEEQDEKGLPMYKGSTSSWA